MDGVPSDDLAVVCGLELLQDDPKARRGRGKVSQAASSRQKEKTKAKGSVKGSAIDSSSKQGHAASTATALGGGGLNVGRRHLVVVKAAPAADQENEADQGAQHVTRVLCHATHQKEAVRRLFDAQVMLESYKQELEQTEKICGDLQRAAIAKSSSAEEQILAEYGIVSEAQSKPSSIDAPQKEALQHAIRERQALADKAADAATAVSPSEPQKGRRHAILAPAQGRTEQPERERGRPSEGVQNVPMELGTYTNRNIPAWLLQDEASRGLIENFKASLRYEYDEAGRLDNKTIADHGWQCALDMITRWAGQPNKILVEKSKESEDKVRKVQREALKETGLLRNHVKNMEKKFKALQEQTKMLAQFQKNAQMMMSTGGFRSGDDSPKALASSPTLKSTGFDIDFYGEKPSDTGKIAGVDDFYTKRHARASTSGRALAEELVKGWSDKTIRRNSLQQAVSPEPVAATLAQEESPQAEAFQALQEKFAALQGQVAKSAKGEVTLGDQGSVRKGAQAEATQGEQGDATKVEQGVVTLVLRQEEHELLSRMLVETKATVAAAKAPEGGAGIDTHGAGQGFASQGLARQWRPTSLDQGSVQGDAVHGGFGGAPGAAAGMGSATMQGGFGVGPGATAGAGFAAMQGGFGGSPGATGAAGFAAMQGGFGGSAGAAGGAGFAAMQSGLGVGPGATAGAGFAAMQGGFGGSAGAAGGAGFAPMQSGLGVGPGATAGAGFAAVQGGLAGGPANASMGLAAMMGGMASPQNGMLVDPRLLSDNAFQMMPDFVPSLAQDQTLDVAGLSEEALETMDHELFEPLKTFDTDLQELMIDVIDEKVRRILALDPSKFKDGKLPFGLRPPGGSSDELQQAELRRIAKEKQAAIDDMNKAIAEKNIALADKERLLDEKKQLLEEKRQLQQWAQRMEDELNELRTKLEQTKNREPEVRIETVEAPRPPHEDREAQTDDWAPQQIVVEEKEVKVLISSSVAQTQTNRTEKKTAAVQTTEHFNSDEDMQRKEREMREELERLSALASAGGAEALKKMKTQLAEADEARKEQRRNFASLSHCFHTTLAKVSGAFNFTASENGQKAVEKLVGKDVSATGEGGLAKLIDPYHEAMPAMEEWASESVRNVQAFLAKRQQSAMSLERLQKELDELRKRHAEQQDELARLLLMIDELRARLSKVRRVENEDGEVVEELEEFINDDLSPTELKGVFQRLYEDGLQRITRGNLVMQHMMTGAGACDAAMAQTQDSNLNVSLTLQKLNETVKAALRGMWYNAEYVFRHVCTYAFEQGMEQTFSQKAHTASVTKFLQDDAEIMEEDSYPRPPAAERLRGRRGERPGAPGSGTRTAYPCTAGGEGKTLWHPLPGGLGGTEYSPRQMRKKHLVKGEREPSQTFTQYVAGLREARGDAPSGGAAGEPPVRTADDIQWHRSPALPPLAQSTGARQGATPSAVGKNMGSKSASLPSLPRRALF